MDSSCGSAARTSSSTTPRSSLRASVPWPRAIASASTWSKARRVYRPRTSSRFPEPLSVSITTPCRSLRWGVAASARFDRRPFRTTSAPALLIDPPVDLLGEDRHRQGAVAEHGVVEAAEVELRSQLLLGVPAQ